jgi:hypothetical protein
MAGTIAAGAGIAVSGTITVSSTESNVSSSYTSNGAISEKEGLVIIDYSAGGISLTLAAPTSGTDDGKVLRILDISTRGGGGGSRNLVTTGNTSYGGYNATWTQLYFNAVASGTANYAVLVAYQGHWNLVTPGNATAVDTA